MQFNLKIFKYNTHRHTYGRTDSFDREIAILLKIPKFLAEIPDLYA